MAKSKSARAFVVYRRMAESDRKALKWSGHGIYSVSVGEDGSLARTRYCADFEDLTLFFGECREQGYSGAPTFVQRVWVASDD